MVVYIYIYVYIFIEHGKVNHPADILHQPSWDVAIESSWIFVNYSWVDFPSFFLNVYRLPKGKDYHFMVSQRNYPRLIVKVKREINQRFQQMRYASRICRGVPVKVSPRKHMDSSLAKFTPCKWLYSYWCLVGNGWEWGNGMIITSDYGSFPHSLLSTSKYYICIYIYIYIHHITGHFRT